MALIGVGYNAGKVVSFKIKVTRSQTRVIRGTHRSFVTDRGDQGQTEYSVQTETTGGRADATGIFQWSPVSVVVGGGGRVKLLRFIESLKLTSVQRIRAW